MKLLFTVSSHRQTAEMLVSLYLQFQLTVAGAVIRLIVNVLSHVGPEHSSARELAPVRSHQTEDYLAVRMVPKQELVMSNLVQVNP